jgi:hypothetical protein
MPASSRRASSWPLTVRSPPASAVKNVTPPRFASAITLRRVDSTRGGSTRPSEKNTIALRPGAVLSPLTSARIEFMVVSPCWSRSRASDASSIATCARSSK